MTEPEDTTGAPRPGQIGTPAATAPKEGGTQVNSSPADLILIEALRYAGEFRWRLIPLKPGTNHPTMKEWPDLATNDTKQVEAWWGGEFRGWGIGLATGPESGVFAVDVDPRNGGFDTLYSWECVMGHGLMPTLTSHTPRGGHHYFYSYPVGRHVKNNGHALREFGGGIEVKSNRLQIALPPTVRDMGAYRWADLTVPPAEAPEWMLDDLVGKPNPLGGGEDWGMGEGLADGEKELYRRILAGERCPAGFRDIFVSARAYQLRRLGWSQADALRDLSEAYRWMEQPFGNEFTWDMVEAKVEHKWERHEPQSVVDWPASRLTLGGPVCDAERAAQGDSERATRLLTAKERRNKPTPTWRVDRLIPETGAGVLYGAPYVGKTFVGIDLALALCNGLSDWHGRQINTPGHVVYALMEGAFDFQQRIEAWLAAHPDMSDERLFTLEEEELDIGSSQSLQRLIGDIKAANANPVLVIVDTQGLATPGREENDATEMNQVYGLCKKLGKLLDCFVLLIHHTGWDESRIRGASAQQGAAEVILKVSQGTIFVEKVKAAKNGDNFYFALEDSRGSVWARSVNGLTVAIKQQAADRSLRDRIIAVARDNPGIAKTTLAGRVGTRKYVVPIIESMIGGGELENRGGEYSKLYVPGSGL